MPASQLQGRTRIVLSPNEAVLGHVRMENDGNAEGGRRSWPPTPDFSKKLGPESEQCQDYHA